MTRRPWPVRAGKRGEREQGVPGQGSLQPGFDRVGSLVGRGARDAITKELAAVWPDAGVGTVRNFAAHPNRFVNATPVDGPVAPPRGLAPQVAIGRTAGPCRHGARSGPARPAAWRHADAPRQVFGKDLPRSFGALLMIGEISRHEAVARVESVLEHGADPGLSSLAGQPAAAGEEAVGTEEVLSDLGARARDQSRSLAATRLAGHELTRSVAALLEAEGCTTSLSPPVRAAASTPSPARRRSASIRHGSWPNADRATRFAIHPR